MNNNLIVSNLRMLEAIIKDLSSFWWRHF